MEHQAVLIDRVDTEPEDLTLPKAAAAPIGTVILNRSGSARRTFFTVERGQGVTFRPAGFGRLTDRT
jgi:hypothetical protein